MKRLNVLVISAFLLTSCLACAAQAACGVIRVRERVEVEKSELTLADLLVADACLPWQQAARQVSLGEAPRSGSLRVIEGSEVRQLLAAITGSLGAAKPHDNDPVVPARIVVQRERATKSCVAIADFLSSTGNIPHKGDVPAVGQWEELNCTAAWGVPAEASLELIRTSWNAALQRWEFAMRCSHSADCVPFLVWARGEKPAERGASSLPARLGGSRPAGAAGGPLIKAGQTATLIWNQDGIRIVLPVTCLDAGAMGDKVRVRFKQTRRILQAEVVGAGELRANL
jgi:hypothetical protein